MALLLIDSFHSFILDPAQRITTLRHLSIVVSVTATQQHLQQK